MFKRILTAIFPPVAVCRYGCINSCTLPITGFWIGGLVLLGYFLFGGHRIANELIKYGSLAGGLGLLAIAFIWAQSTIAQVGQGKCTNTDISSSDTSSRRAMCRPIPRANTGSVTSTDDDPLESGKSQKPLIGYPSYVW
ncbi:MAG TPA: hypothetical protein DD827_00905 [Gammaproteobacteria bacterium]|nr:hypothetical protein [Gammaproteobacteria bacterium]